MLYFGRSNTDEYGKILPMFATYCERKSEIQFRVDLSEETCIIPIRLKAKTHAVGKLKSWV